jgi:hypothetical protein
MNPVKDLIDLIINGPIPAQEGEHKRIEMIKICIGDLGGVEIAAKYIGKELDYILSELENDGYEGITLLDLLNSYTS